MGDALRLLQLAEDLAFIVDGVLEPVECASVIVKAERAGLTDAPVNASRDEGVRNNDRIIFDDREWARTLFERLSTVIPHNVIEGYVPVGFNERLRVYRYRPGQYFRLHRDGYWEDARGRSTHTVLIYLNDGYAGGETHLYDLEEWVTPRLGMALFFRHSLLHEGCPLLSGTKYVLRTDLLCRPS